MCSALRAVARSAWASLLVAAARDAYQLGRANKIFSDAGITKNNGKDRAAMTNLEHMLAKAFISSVRPDSPSTRHCRPWPFNLCRAVPKGEQDYQGGVMSTFYGRTV
jgi:hypothetical protein